MTLPSWCLLVRADNPGPMTLDGTNTYVLPTVVGNVVVDPGPLDEGHLESVAALGEVVMTLLTHGHPDHAAGAGRFHQITAAPTRALETRLCIEAEPLDADDTSVGVAGLDLQVLHTPGHSADSVSFVARVAGSTGVLTGDTILGSGSTVVSYPDGRLGPYLASLARLRQFSGAVLLPGHGAVQPDVAAMADAYLAHRRERLAQVRAALAAGATSPAEVVQIVYADVDRSLWPAAELSVRAQLDYLAETGTPT